MDPYSSPYPPYPSQLDLDDLAQAPEPLVRAILLTLCDDDGNRARALHYLGRLLDFENDTRGGSFSGSASGTTRRGAGSTDDLRSPITTSTGTAGGAAAAGNPRKRKKTGDPKICVQCDGIYTDEENEFGACSYHSGILQVFDETKVDPDMADVDTPYNRIAFPDAFRWICCPNSGATQSGCRRGRHESNPDRSLKGRGDNSHDSSLDEDPLSLDSAPTASGTGRDYGEEDDEEEEENNEERYQQLREETGIDNRRLGLRLRQQSLGEGDDDDEARSGRAYRLYGHQHSGSSGASRPLTTRTAVPTSGRGFEGGEHNGRSHHRRHRESGGQRAPKDDTATESSSRRRTRG